MTAVDIDRSISAKATPGVWLDDFFKDQRNGWHIIWVGAAVVAETGHHIRSKNAANDAADIIRRHNRQPLYDAFVDAVRVALVTGTPMDLPRNLGMVGAALAALDQEQT